MKLEKDFKIPFIYADDCECCMKMNQYLEELCKIHDCQLIKYDCETDEAVDVAFDLEIDELPGCAIGYVVFKGDNFNYNSMEDAILLWKQEHGC